MVFFFFVEIRFLVIVDGIVAAYSLVQVVRCIMGMIRGSVLFSKPLAWIIFSGDQVYDTGLCLTMYRVMKLSFCVKSNTPPLLSVLRVVFHSFQCNTLLS